MRPITEFHGLGLAQLGPRKRDESAAGAVPTSRALARRRAQDADGNDAEYCDQAAPVVVRERRCGGRGKADCSGALRGRGCGGCSITRGACLPRVAAPHHVRGANTARASRVSRAARAPGACSLDRGPCQHARRSAQNPRAFGAAGQARVVRGAAARRKAAAGGLLRLFPEAIDGARSRPDRLPAASNGLHAAQ